MEVTLHAKYHFHANETNALRTSQNDFYSDSSQYFLCTGTLNVFQWCVSTTGRTSNRDFFLWRTNFISHYSLDEIKHFEQFARESTQLFYRLFNCLSCFFLFSFSINFWIYELIVDFSNSRNSLLREQGILFREYLSLFLFWNRCYREKIEDIFS